LQVRQESRKRQQAKRWTRSWAPWQRNSRKAASWVSSLRTFSVIKRKAREGRNPQTGKAIKIPAKKVVKFKAGKGLGDKVK
jgi:hypothetical protein